MVHHPPRLHLVDSSRLERVHFFSLPGPTAPGRGRTARCGCKSRWLDLNQRSPLSESGGHSNLPRTTNQSAWLDLNQRSPPPRGGGHSKLPHTLKLATVQVPEAFETNAGIEPATLRLGV